MRTFAAVLAALLLVACGSSSSGSKESFCARAKTLQAQDEQGGSGAASTDKQSAAEFHALAKIAPREIKGDVEMFAHALDLNAAGDSTALNAQRAQIVQATKELDDYLANTCGLATVTSTT